MIGNKFRGKCYIFVEHFYLICYNTNDNMKVRIMNVKLGNLKSLVLDLWYVVYSLYSTNVECSLQIYLFMQNKANFRKSQMNVNNYIAVDYVKMDTWSSWKKQSQTNPKQSQSKPISSYRAKVNRIVWIIDGCYNAIMCRQSLFFACFALLAAGLLCSQMNGAN